MLLNNVSLKEALVIGGSNGIGLSVVMNLNGYDKIHIIDKIAPEKDLPVNIRFHEFDLLNADYSVFDQFTSINTLIITAGFGRLALFKDVQEDEIINSFMVNSIGVIRIIKRFYNKMLSTTDFYCAVMGSISGYLSSPFYSIYGATKAALCKFIESVNVELEKNGTNNRILNISSGSIAGTKFNNGKENDLDSLKSLTIHILEQLYTKSDLYIPDYEKTYKEVLNRYQTDFRSFGLQSYDYKLNKIDNNIF